MSEARFTMAEEDKAVFDAYSKEQIYEAYLSEYYTRKMLEAEANKLRRVISDMKYRLSSLLKNLS